MKAPPFPDLGHAFRPARCQVIDGQICFKASRRSVVQDVYSARARLHEEVYFHPVAKAADLMVVNALALAAEELGIAGWWWVMLEAWGWLSLVE